MTWLVCAIFGISYSRDFWKFWSCPCFTRAISKFSKMHSGSLSQIAFTNMWLLVLIICEKQGIKITINIRNISMVGIIKNMVIIKIINYILIAINIIFIIIILINLSKFCISCSWSYLFWFCLQIVFSQFFSQKEYFTFHWLDLFF